NALAGADTILLPAGTFTLTRAGAGEDAAATGDLDITDALTIQGAGSGQTIIDVGALDRVFQIAASVPVSISGVTIRNGSAPATAGDQGEGGGIYIRGNFALTPATTIMLTDVVITGCKAAEDGGGVACDAGNTTLVLTGTTVS